MRRDELGLLSGTKVVRRVPLRRTQGCWNDRRCDGGNSSQSGVLAGLVLCVRNAEGLQILERAGNGCSLELQKEHRPDGTLSLVSKTGFQTFDLQHSTLSVS